MSINRLVRIVPRKPEDGSPVSTMGTEIFVGDTKIEGVYAVTIRGEAGDIWRATLECAIAPPDELLAELGDIKLQDQNRISDNEAIDVTSISNTSKRHVV